MIAVTGSSGFIGKAVVEHLVLQKQHILTLTRTELISHNKLIFNQVVGDIDAKTSYCFSELPIDAVIHCAALVESKSKQELDVYKEVNTLGTLNLARQAAKIGVKRFIFISSIKVNGDCTEYLKPFTESVESSPVDSYALSKYEAEKGLKKIAEQTDMEVVIIRPPLVYGPGVKGNFFRFIKLASYGLPLPFAAIKNNFRSMVYIDNLVDLIVSCLFHPKAANGTFLVSDDDDLSTASLTKQLNTAFNNKTLLLPIPVSWFKVIAKLTNKKSTVERLCGSLQVDISTTKKQLGWQPKVSVEDGILETVKHYQEVSK